MKIHANLFRITEALPSTLYWAQAVRTNQTVGVAPPHESSPDPEQIYLDISTAAGHALPPLYPGQYGDEHFSDRPGRVCLENSTVYWDAVTMLTDIDREERLLTVYGGFSYGFKIVCTPEPLTLNPASRLANVSKSNSVSAPSAENKLAEPKPVEL